MVMYWFAFDFSDGFERDPLNCEKKINDRFVIIHESKVCLEDIYSDYTTKTEMLTLGYHSGHIFYRVSMRQV